MRRRTDRGPAAGEMCERLEKLEAYIIPSSDRSAGLLRAVRFVSTAFD